MESIIANFPWFRNPRTHTRLVLSQARISNNSGTIVLSAPSPKIISYGVFVYSFQISPRALQFLSRFVLDDCKDLLLTHRTDSDSKLLSEIIKHKYNQVIFLDILIQLCYLITKEEEKFSDCGKLSFFLNFILVNIYFLVTDLERVMHDSVMSKIKILRPLKNQQFSYPWYRSLQPHQMCDLMNIRFERSNPVNANKFYDWYFTNRINERYESTFPITQKIAAVFNFFFSDEGTFDLKDRSVSFYESPIYLYDIVKPKFQNEKSLDLILRLVDHLHYCDMKDSVQCKF